tara:strand:- start:497 stop:1189 length:693 start_codon:yes stop_codon:yes gene_type:complete
MDQNLLDFYLNEQVQISASNFIEAIVFSAILSLLIQFVYIKFSSTLSDKFEFSKNFVILGLATTLIITIVKSSLALSLGLVGALSIVRFRAAIKEPEELVYLFLIIATGLGCGAGQIMITAIGVIISLFIIIIYSIFIKKRQLHGDQITNFTIIFAQRIPGVEIDRTISQIKKFCLEMRFISLSSTDNETILNLDIKVKSFEKLNQISKQIEKKYSNSKVLFSKNNSLSL